MLRRLQYLWDYIHMQYTTPSQSINFSKEILCTVGHVTLHKNNNKYTHIYTNHTL